MFIKYRLNGTQLHLCFASHSFTIPHAEGRETPRHVEVEGWGSECVTICLKVTSDKQHTQRKEIIDTSLWITDTR